MPQAALDNLVRIGQLKAEARNDLEVARLLGMARTRFDDAQVASISAEGRFTSIYNASSPLPSIVANDVLSGLS